MSNREPLLGRGAGELVGMAGAATMLAGFGVIGYRAVMWLKTGAWSMYELRDLWERKPILVDWIGFQKIIDFAVSLPLPLFLIFGGVAVVFYGAYLQENRP